MVLMGQVNRELVGLINQHGALAERTLRQLRREAAEAGVDGFIVPDLPAEESEEWALEVWIGSDAKGLHGDGGERDAPHRSAVQDLRAHREPA